MALPSRKPGQRPLWVGDQREEKHFPLLTKGDEGGLDTFFLKAKMLRFFEEVFLKAMRRIAEKGLI
jgi:hypothetical protein